MDSLASDVTRLTVDFLQYAESYYFHDGDDHTSLAVNISYATELADQGERARHTDVGLAAAVLATALEDLAVVLDDRFLRTGGPARETYRAFLDDHGLSGSDTI